MNISSVSTSSLSSLSSLASVTGTSSTSDTSTDPSVSGDQTHMSKMGKLMSQLQDLEKSDPTKAKAVLNQIASQLKSEAASTGDSKMADLASKFATAAQTGDLSGLQPKGGHHGGHGGPPPADASGSSDPSSSTSASTSATASYAKNGSDPMAEIESILSQALAGTSTTTST